MTDYRLEHSGDPEIGYMTQILAEDHHIPVASVMGIRVFEDGANVHPWGISLLYDSVVMPVLRLNERAWSLDGNSKTNDSGIPIGQLEIADRVIEALKRFELSNANN